MGLCPRRDRGGPRRSRYVMAGEGIGAVEIRRLRPGAASGAALRHCNQRRRIFLGIPGDPGGGVGGGAAGRTRADAAARLHPDRQCQSQAADAKAHAAARLFGEALGELNALGFRHATAAGDGLVDAFPTAALAALLKAKLAQPTLSKADWLEFGKIDRV